MNGKVWSFRSRQSKYFLIPLHLISFSSFIITYKALFYLAPTTLWSFICHHPPFFSLMSISHNRIFFSFSNSPWVFLPMMLTHVTYYLCLKNHFPSEFTWFTSMHSSDFNYNLLIPGRWPPTRKDCLKSYHVLSSLYFFIVLTIIAKSFILKLFMWCLSVGFLKADTLSVVLGIRSKVSISDQNT